MNKSILLSVIAVLFIFTSSPAHTETIIQWTEAAQHINENITVEGTVYSIGVSRGASCYLFFDENDKECFTVEIPRENFYHFPQVPPVGLYIKKKVRVTGLIRHDKGKPVMTATTPLQIEVFR